MKTIHILIAGEINILEKTYAKVVPIKGKIVKVGDKRFVVISSIQKSKGHFNCYVRGNK